MEFSFKDIFNLLKRRFALIAFNTFTGLCLFFLFSKYVIKPSYMASVQMYVNTYDSTSSADLNGLNYAQKVVATYIKFLETNVFYKQVIEESNLNYTQAELKEMTNIQTVNNTEIFQISVTSHYPDHSYKLVEVMQKIAPELISSMKDKSEISVVDPVILPTIPISPNIVLNTVMGGVLGFIISILISLLWEIHNINIKNQDDLLRRYQLPILGSIPNFDLRNNRKFRLSKLKTKVKDSMDVDNKFLIAEAFKSLRMNLRFALRMNVCKKFIISSPGPGEGKSTTSANLAITIAQSGAKVLLMDCDLRKGKLHEFFNIKNTPGISDILSGMYNEKDVIRNTNYENLQVLPIGTIPPNPTELLSSAEMERLISSLEKEYDYILIDTPPVNVVSDSLGLVMMVDGVVIVVRESITSHPSIVSAIRKYDFLEAKILGFVINDVSLNQGNKSSHYYHHNDTENHD